MSLLVEHHGRRSRMKVDLSTPLKEALPALCTEIGIPAERVVLKHRGKPIDLGIPFRLTGVPSNATVQLSLGSGGGARVRVLLQTRDHGRLQGEFSDRETIGDVVASFQAQGRLPPAMRNVSAVYTRTKVEGDDLARRSLRALGIKKSAMLRLQFDEGEPQPAAPAAASAGPVAVPAPAPAPVPAPANPARAPPPPAPAASASAAPSPPAQPSPPDGAGVTAAAAASASPPAAPPPPHKSLDTCGRAIAALRAAAFDADAAPAVRLLVRVLDNVISRPADPRTRSLKLSSKAFARHASLPGVKEFLWGAGFRLQVPSAARQSRFGLNPLASDRPSAPADAEGFLPSPADDVPRLAGSLPDDARLTLREEDEDAALLKRCEPRWVSLLRLSPFPSARALLLGPAAEMGVQVPQAPPTPATSAGAAGGGTGDAPQPAFDPFKPSVTRFNPVPSTDGQATLGATERRVERLRARKDELVAASVPDRQIHIFLTRRGAAAAATASSPRSQPQAGAGAAAAAGAAGEGPSSDLKMVMDAAKRRRQELAESQVMKTRAMRELEQLQKAQVYATAAIRVVLPDQSEVHLMGGAGERVQALLQAVVDLMRPGMIGKEPYLYLSPPPTRLSPKATLHASGLVPAARLYLSWAGADLATLRSLPPGSLLHENALRRYTADAEASSAITHAPAVPLDPEAQRSRAEAERRESAAAGEAQGQSGAASSASSASSARRGKPKWLKV